ncbi:MAG: serine hydrolase [Phaeodactylibacter sp.]|nr:serine hydrolase [Phaeodactylibacter sp.]
MTRLTIIYFIWITICSGTVHAQDMRNYNGSWAGTFPEADAFKLSLQLEGWASNQVHLILYQGTKSLAKAQLHENANGIFTADLAPRLQFKGYTNKDGQLSGFLTSGILQYHLSFKPEQNLRADWLPIMVDTLLAKNIYLSIENGKQDQFEAYPFFQDDRFTGTWCSNFRKQNSSLFFNDFKTGLDFEAQLGQDQIDLSVKVAAQVIANVTLFRFDEQWRLGVPYSTSVRYPNENIVTGEVRKPSISVDTSLLNTLSRAIESDTLPNTHSILVAKEGILVYEAYFDGYHSNLPHDLRSASKSISSTAIGIALKEGLLESVDQPIYGLLPNNYTSNLEAEKKTITLHHLLTMSSGIDAIDFGTDKQSAAAEHVYQSSSDWLKTVLNAPMINTPGKQAYYGTANPYLLGVGLSNQSNISLSIWLDRMLFQHLGIDHYLIQNDMCGQPYFGGGMYLSPIDFLKYGHLYLEKGRWGQDEILAESWVGQSFQPYLKLENTNDQNEYGYLWWHHTYTVGTNSYTSWEARGAGGQYCFVIPELELVAVINSGNFRNGKFQQPEQILESYLLPAILAD